MRAVLLVIAGAAASTVVWVGTLGGLVRHLRARRERDRQALRAGVPPVQERPRSFSSVNWPLGRGGDK